MGDRIKFLLIGDSAVGKSSLIQKYTAGTFGMNGISTIGVEYVKKDIDTLYIDTEFWRGMRRRMEQKKKEKEKLWGY